MKKLMALILALVLVLSLAACGKSNNQSSNNNSSNNSSGSGSNVDDKGESNNSSDSEAKALTDSKIFVDLEDVVTDTTPHKVNDIIMVPVQAVMEKIGYDINWIPEEKKLEVWEPSRQHPTIILTVGSTTAYYEKYAAELDERVSYEGTLDTAPILVNEKMLAPLNFLADAIGYTVDSNVDSADIYIFSPAYMENQEGEGIGVDQPVADPDEIGEGVGQTQALSDDEKTYVLGLTTNSWLDLEQAQKEEVISLMARWWDVVDGYIVEDFDSVLADLDHQMETYFRNGVDEGVLQTACDIYGLDAAKYVR